MPCDRKLKQGQSIQSRADEIKKAIQGLDAAIRMGNIKPIISPQGAIAFQGWNNGRDDVTDVCAYRRLMASGSASAKAAIARAEALAGRTVSKAMLQQGVHSHDGGQTWHSKG